MKCKNCGAEISPGSRFCIECGTRVEEEQPAFQPQYTPPQAQQYSQPTAQDTARRGSWSQYMNQPGSAASDNPVLTRDIPDPSQGPAQPQYSAPVYTPPYSEPAAPTSAARPQPAALPQEIVIRPHSTGGANALLITLSVLVFAVLLFIYLTVMPGSSSGGKSGSSGSAAAPAGQESSRPTDTAESTAESAAADPAAVLGDFDFNFVPADIQALIKTNPVSEDYYGNYTGSITYQFFGGDFLKSMGMPADQLAYYEEISGKTYSVTAEYADEELVGYCTELPIPNENNRVFRFWIYGDLEDGIYEEDEIDAEEAFSFQISERVYFLNDGSLYVVSGVVASQDGEPRGGAVYRSRLVPEG